MKKKRFSIQEHIEMGKKLKNMQKELRDVYEKIQSAYSKTTRVVSRLERAVSGINTIEKVCLDMDDIVIRETDREEWICNGYSNIYLGNECNFIQCTECGAYVLQERTLQSVIDGGALCTKCYGKHNQ